MSETFSSGFVFGCVVMLLPWLIGTVCYWQGRAAEKSAPASAERSEDAS